MNEEENELCLCHGRFKEENPEELAVWQAKKIFNHNGFSVNEIVIENEKGILKKRKFSQTRLDGNGDFLENQENMDVIKGIWSKFDKAWIFKLVPEPNQGIMFRIQEIK